MRKRTYYTFIFKELQMKSGPIFTLFPINVVRVYELVKRLGDCSREMRAVAV